MESSIFNTSVSLFHSLLWNGTQLAVFLVSQSLFCPRSASFKEGIFKGRPTFKRKVFVLLIVPFLIIAGLSQVGYLITPRTLLWSLSFNIFSSLCIIILTQILLDSSIVVFCYQSAYSLVHGVMLFSVESNLLRYLLKGRAFPWEAVPAYVALVTAAMGVTMLILYNYRKEWKPYSYAERHRTAFYMAIMSIWIGPEPVVLLLLHVGSEI